MNWQAVVEKTVTGLGYELVECERSPQGLLRVYIDNHSPANGTEPVFITVDDCEKVTRQLQYVLEVEGLDYARLEISSPGVDRLIRNTADFVRFTGQEVAITLKTPFKGKKKYSGILEPVEVSGAEEPGWRLVFREGDTEQALGFTLEEIREARLVPVLDFKGRNRRQAAEPVVEGQEHGGHAE